MFVGASYLTNEVKGSFWRPGDYMAKVPQAHITALDPGINVSISSEGRLLSENSKNKADEKSFFESEDGVVKRYKFDIHTGNLEYAEAF